VAHAIRVAGELAGDDVIIVNLSGRGDKDVDTVKQNLL
jgi:tryptophan synthase beta subunit